MKNLFGDRVDTEQALSLAARVHPKYRPVFEKLPERERAALALYFLPHRSRKMVLEVTRPRVLKWYCPFADQRKFPSCHRYCVNVYTGCEHRCQYCYAAGYADRQAGCKQDFRRDFVKDLDDLEKFEVPAAPVHVSNSTDPLQSLELEHRHSLFVLEKLVERRHRFTTVTLLTKNPAVLMEQRYLDVLWRLNALAADHPRSAWFAGTLHSPLRVECSLAFFNDESRQLFDPAAPSVSSRLQAIRVLREHNVPTYVRVDPLFPRNPLPSGKSMDDFGLPDAQPLSDLEQIVRFCRGEGVAGIIYSVAKITLPRDGSLSPTMQRMKSVYAHLAAPNPLVFRGGSWRLPDVVAKDGVVDPFLQICARYSIDAKPCMVNLISTP
jgi:DNA repair photolyase